MGIKVTDVAFIRYQAPDLDKMEEFLLDFGMVRAERTADTLYMRGLEDSGYLHVTHLGDEPKVLGFGFDATSVADLDQLAAEGVFSAVGELDGPGGGRQVHAIDPDGFEVWVVADRGPVGELPRPDFPDRNEYSAAGYPRVGSPVRLAPGPSHVKRLGHVLYACKDYQVSRAWYSDNLGFVISDEVHTPDGKALGAFLRCDRGAEYTDHHTLGLMGRTGETAFGHSAYEVAGWDDLMLGNATLKSKGYDHANGIGRHILGSQVNDYWFDPFGNTVEHWTDGDRFNNETPPNLNATVEELAGDQWGPANTFRSARRPAPAR